MFMGLRDRTEAVWIDDGVWDMNGVFVGWLDGTEDTRKNVEAYYLVYKEPVDSNKSFIYKLLGGLFKIWYSLTGSKDSARRAGLSISPEPIPKAAIEGFPEGKTVDVRNTADSAPEKKIIIREDLDGESAYNDAVWGTESSEGESITELKDKVEDLKQRLRAEEGKTEELKQETERDEPDRRGRNTDLFPDDNRFDEEGVY